MQPRMGDEEGVDAQLRAPPDAGRGVRREPHETGKKRHMRGDKDGKGERVGQAAQKGKQPPFRLRHRVELVGDEEGEASVEDEGGGSWAGLLALLLTGCLQFS